MGPLVTGIRTALVGLLLIPLLATPAHAFQILLWPNNQTFTVFGPNQAITIDTGSMDFVTGCFGGFDDFILPATDIYIVESGTVSVGNFLVDVGGAFNPVVGTGSGAFLGETIGFTVPGGNIGAGLYAVVYDECQDGFFDFDDFIVDPAFRVDLPPVLPPVDPVIAQIKSDAGSQATEWGIMTAEFAALVTIYKLDNALSIAMGDPVAIATTAVSQALQEALGVPSPEDATLKLMTDMVGHYAALAADPPDPNFQQLTPIDPLQRVDSGTSEPVWSAAHDGLGNAAGLEGSVALAALRSIERYQGAENAGNSLWALTHARALASYAALLADLQTQTAAALTDMAVAITSDSRPFDDLQTQWELLRTDVALNGLPQEVVDLYTDLGFSSVEIDDLEAELVAQDFSSFSETSFLTLLGDLSGLASQAAASWQTAATDATNLGDTIANDPGVNPERPLADAGGPYFGTQGTPVPLDASGSSDPDGSIVSWDWDLDLDGSFDDASGETPSFAFDPVGDILVGVRVVDDAGNDALAYTRVSVARSSLRPTIDSFAPVPLLQLARAGTTTSFSCDASDADGPAVSSGTFAWFVDGVSQGSGSSFDYSPAAPGDVGIHFIDVEVTDAGSPPGGTATARWLVGVVPPTGTPAPDDDMAVRIGLLGSFPNPFNPSTRIEFALPPGDRATLEIFDASGRRVRRFPLASQADTQWVEWNGRDDRGRRVASGSYVVRLVTAHGTDELRVTLLK